MTNLQTAAVMHGTHITHQARIMAFILAVVFGLAAVWFVILCIFIYFSLTTR